MEKKIVAFLKERIASMGVTQSGAYEYYAARVGRGLALGAYEAALLQRIRELKPRRIVHAGIGIGALEVILASEGFRIIGYEHDRTRFAAAVALRNEMGDSKGVAYELHCETYPDHHNGNGGLLLFTDVGSGWSTEQEEKTLATFQNFDTVILDLARFGRSRDEKQRNALMNTLSGLGTVRPLETWQNYFFVELKPRLSFKPPH